MTRQVQDAELRVFHPGNNSDSLTSSGDFTVPAEDIASAETKQSVLIDRGKCTIEIRDDDSASYVDKFRVGDRAALFIDFGAGFEWVFTAHVLTWTAELVDVNDVRITIEQANDFLASLLARRTASNAFEGRQVVEDTPQSGSSSAIVNVLLADGAPEIDVADDTDKTRTLDFQVDNRDLFEAVNELADRVGAIWGSERDTLVWKDQSGLSADLQLSNSDVRLPIERSRDGVKLANKIIVEDGTGYQTSLGNTTQSSYVTVTNVSRESFVFTPETDELKRLDVWTRTTGSGDNVVVRIQRDDGSGNPIAPGDRTRDLGRDAVAAADLDSDGFTRFFPDATGYSDQVAVIVESDGGTGQDIGTDGNGNITYQPYVAFTLDVFVEEPDSIDQYRRADLTINPRYTQTEDSARELGNSKLRRRIEPDTGITLTANSTEAHTLAPTDVFDYNFSRLNIDGTWVVTRREVEYDGTQATTSLTAARRDTI